MSEIKQEELEEILNFAVSLARKAGQVSWLIVMSALLIRICAWWVMQSILVYVLLYCLILVGH